MSYKKLTVIFTLFALSASGVNAQTCPANHPNEFKVEFKRLGQDEVVDAGKKVKRTFGDIGLNNKNIGRFYENSEKLIPAGSYRGTMRYKSDHNFVQQSCGEISREGDFLLEIADVKNAVGVARTNILLHPGSKPSHSAGCMLLGARKFDAAGKPLPLGNGEPLVVLRREFYGTDTPNACPNKIITIVVTDP